MNLQLDNKSTHLKGLLGEIEFVRHFLKEAGIFINHLIKLQSGFTYRKRNKFKKIQIKYCTPYKGVLRVELTHPGKDRKPYCPDDIDAIVFLMQKMKFLFNSINGYTSQTRNMDSRR